ncbi:hypothetical protein AA313_de0205373 [Arthrobotrys entomopaga]|nr:hypothetical protein AA313_de0205373 [Arthrobotrys entomopaga]
MDFAMQSAKRDCPRAGSAARGCHTLHQITVAMPPVLCQILYAIYAIYVIFLVSGLVKSNTHLQPFCIRFDHVDHPALLATHPPPTGLIFNLARINSTTRSTYLEFCLCRLLAFRFRKFHRVA